MNSKSHRAGVWVDPLLRPLAVGAIPASGLEVTVTPDADELKTMARALDLADIQFVKGVYRLSHRSGGMVSLEGELTAQVQPVCVASLEPFPLSIREPVMLRFAPPSEAESDPEDVLGADDPPDPIENGIIDLGRVTTEFLSLAIPAFPRKPGSAFAVAEETPVKSPFSALSVLKERKPG